MEYLLPASLEEAFRLVEVQAAAGRTARFVAGGTDLAVQLAGGTPSPDALVDISGLAELAGIERDGGGLRVGAAVTLAELAGRQDLPAGLVQGARAIGSPQIRALGTLGGNLCNASPCGDTLAPVVALGGLLVLASAGGRREVRAEEFFTGPKATVLRSGEMLVEVRFGADALTGRSAFRMIGQRNGQAISQVNVAIWVVLAGGAHAGSGSGGGGGSVVTEIRAAAGSVAPTPLRLRQAERVVRGRPFTAELARAAGEAAAAEILPISDVRASAEYRRAATAGLLREALAEACLTEAGGP